MKENKDLTIDDVIDFFDSLHKFILKCANKEFPNDVNIPIEDLDKVSKDEMFNMCRAKLIETIYEIFISKDQERINYYINMYNILHKLEKEDNKQFDIYMNKYQPLKDFYIILPALKNNLADFEQLIKQM